jgi:hypothetical protein
MCESIVFQLHFDSSSDIIKLVPVKNIIYSFEKQLFGTLKESCRTFFSYVLSDGQNSKAMILTLFVLTENRFSYRVKYKT